MELSKSVKDSFLNLVRLGIGYTPLQTACDFDWQTLQEVAANQGLSGVVLDGIEKLPLEHRPAQDNLVQWIGEVLLNENDLDRHWNAACEMAEIFDRNNIRTYLLKGAVISECYPKPSHRFSSDVDCFLLSKDGSFSAWEKANDLMREQGCEVTDDFYKHSDFTFSGTRVENHRVMTPCRGNKWLTKMEYMLQMMIKEDKGEDRIGDSFLCRPPLMVSALFIIEHSYSHFMSEGLCWRHITDWVMFEKKHKKEIDWDVFLLLLEEFGLKKFFDSFSAVCKYLVGDVPDSRLKKRDKLLMGNIWKISPMVDDYRGFLGKISLAWRIMCSGWKYHHYSVVSMPHALWIYIKGYFFSKIPEI